MKLSRTASLTGILLLLSSPAHADVVTIVAGKDNTLYESTDGSISNGSGDRFFAGRTNQGAGEDLRRGLLEFDVAGVIPPGSTIHSVTLQLYMSKTIAGPIAVSLHRALAEWGEGPSYAGGGEGVGIAAEDGDATWLHTFHPSQFWSTAGGDYSPIPSATTSVGGNGFYTWSSVQMDVEVQAWLDDDAQNHGWVVIGNESFVPSVKRFDTREISNQARRPQLTVDFTPGSGGGACCLSDGTCLDLSESDCTLLGGTYQDGVACSSDPCPDPVGACCFDDGTCQELTALACAQAGGAYQGDGSACIPDLCPLVLEPFVDALPIPAPAVPVSGSQGGTAEYDLAITEFTQQLHRDLPLTTVWGYDGTYPGPTLEAGRDLPVTVRWRNDLRDEFGGLRTEHLLPVDTCLHGPATEGNTPRTVVHLHGGHVPAVFDGYPEATILPGEEVTYVYPNDQDAATLWYHDHALGITRLNVMLGLAGFYLVRDPVEAALGLPADEFEIPLVIQDRTFNADGSFHYPADWQDDFFGDKILVNGVVWPFLQVDQGKYRFRVLNGSNSRTFTLSLSTGESFLQIGTDGGLLETPLSLTEITLAPGERADLVLDFESHVQGEEIFLENSAPAPFPGSPGVGVVPDVMKFVVTGDAGDTDPIPPVLRPMEELLESAAVVERQFELRKEQGDPCTGFRWLINGLGWDDITEIPVLDTMEVWSFINDSNMVHPMHMHLVFFQVLDRQDFDLIGGEVVPIGSPMPPDPSEMGWKDTVRAMPQQITRVIARFEDYEGLFAYHCHILEHEDHEMMRQFQSIAGPGTPYCFGVGCPCGNDHQQAGCVNATGDGAVLWGRGSASVTADDMVLETFNVQPGQFGVYYMGPAQTSVPFGNGLRCIAPGGVGFFRFPVQSSGAEGVLELGPGTVGFACAAQAQFCITAGSTWNFQCWYRDPGGPCGASFNLSNAISVPFAP